MRRRLLVLSVIGLTLAATAACGDGTAGDGGKPTLTWETTGGEATENEAKAFQEPYAQATGVTFNNVTAASAESQLKAMVEAGKTEWDVIHIGSYVAQQFCGELFEKLDFSAFPRDLYPAGSMNECSLPATRFGYAFAYNTEVYQGKVPTTIGDFFDTATFPGKRVVRGANGRGVLEAALVADGVDPNQLYPLDIDRGLRKLDTIKDDLIFAPSFTAIQQNMVDEQATMTITLTGRLSKIYDSGGTIAPVWDFSMWDFDAFLVPKGTPNKAEAEKVVQFIHQPEQVKRYATIGGAAPVRSDIDINEIEYNDTAKLFSPFLGDDRGDVVLMDPTYWAEHGTEVAEKWVKWQVG